MNDVDSRACACSVEPINRQRRARDRRSQRYLPHRESWIAPRSDHRVRRLADGIIESQVREIAEMKLPIDENEPNGKRGRSEWPARSADVTPDMERMVREAVK